MNKINNKIKKCLEDSMREKRIRFNVDSVEEHCEQLDDAAYYIADVYGHCECIEDKIEAFIFDKENSRKDYFVAV